VAHPDMRQFVPGADAGPSSAVVTQVTQLPKGLRTTETLRRFTMQENGHQAEMVGTYSTIPDLNWAVVAQRVWTRPAKMRRYGVERPGAQVRARGHFCRADSRICCRGHHTPIRALAASTRAHQPR